MDSLTAQHVTVMLLSLAVLLGTARLFAEIAHRMHQPAVLGEILAGVILGPTVLGSVAPEWNAFLFPAEGPNALVFDGIATLSIVLFLLVAGIEVDLSTVWRQGRLAIKVGVAGVVVPFVIGLGAAVSAPRMLGGASDADPWIFSLFFATALSISALPVIAKTLMDLDLYRSDFGMIVVSAAIFNDLIGWTVFAMILGMIDVEGGHGFGAVATIALSLLFVAVTLTAGRWAINRYLPFLQAYTHSPEGVLGFAMTLSLFGAAFTEWIGVHAIFGSFIIGVAIGDSPHLRESTRMALERFISFIFAPLFFASIGLKVNFITHFDLGLVLTVLAIACVGKLLGATLGARWGGMPGRDALAVGVAMNARGAMEIILGLLALQAGLINQSLFVALVVMAIATSMISGPVMRIVLRLRKPRRLVKSMSAKLFKRHIDATTPRQAIEELAAAICQVHSLDLDKTVSAAWARERTLSTGIGNGVAIPHARLPGLPTTIVALGLSEAGIDFDAPDDELAHAVFLILTPSEEIGAQLEISAEVARIFRDHAMLDQMWRTKNYTELLALLRSANQH